MKCKLEMFRDRKQNLRTRGGRRIITNARNAILAVVLFLVFGSIAMKIHIRYSEELSSDKIGATSTVAPRIFTMAPTTSSMGFIHIGKTGGSAISLLLRNGCHHDLPKPCRIVANETAVSKLVDHYYHVPDFHRLPESNDKGYIISVRDVYDRTISAFLYSHPQNQKAYKSGKHSVQMLERELENHRKVAFWCFPTLEIFVSSLMGTRPTDCDYHHHPRFIFTDNCAKLACAALHGRVRFYTHFFFNYRNILYTKLPTSHPERKIYVIRQEAFWRDWSDVNHLLGHQGDVVIPDMSYSGVRNTTGLKLEVNGALTEEGRTKLCNALELEYVAYFQILLRAENVNAKELEEARSAALRNCPRLELLSLLTLEK